MNSSTSSYDAAGGSAGAVTGAFALGYGAGTLINEYVIEQVIPESGQMAIGEAVFDASSLSGSIH